MNHKNKETNAIWEVSKNYNSGFEPDVEEGLAKLNLRIAASKQQQKTKVVPMRRRFLVRAAAAVLLVGMTAFGISHFMGSSNAEWVAISSNKTVEEFILPDGSSVWLKEDAQLSFIQDFEGTERQLKLEGEAFFDVAKNPNKPFVIQTGEGNVTVLGTSFSIDTKGNQTEVLVKTGKVAFTPNAKAKTVLLTKNMRATFNKETTQTAVEEKVSLNKLAWQTGKLSYRGSKISEILSDLENYYNVSINLKNESLKNCTWTNIINVKDTDIKTSLSTFLKYFELSLIQNGEKIELTGGKEGC